MADDVLDILCVQHRQITEALDAVSTGPIDSRASELARLSELLLTHEAAEELLLRPITRGCVPGGELVADARSVEEGGARRHLVMLDHIGVESAEFRQAFDGFASQVCRHLDSEETYEFPLIREYRPAESLVAMGAALTYRATMVADQTLNHTQWDPRTAAMQVARAPITAVVGKVRGVLAPLASGG